MGLFDFLRRKPIETKESAAGRVMVMSPGQPAWSGRDYKAFAEEAYVRNVVAYRSINRIADAVATAKWTLWRGDQEVVSHPLLDLIHDPNPMQSGVEYLRAKVSYLLIAGNSYEERVTVGGQPRELYQLRPDRMKVIPGGNGMPLAYEYDANGRKVRWDMDPATGACDVRHLKTFNPINDWYGHSSVEAGAYAVDQHNEAMAWIQALLQNSARPSGALVVGDGSAGLTDEQFHRLKQELEQTYQGARNAGRPMLLEGGLDWRAMGMSPVDMQIIETKSSAARDVAQAFGVPAQLLGIPGDSTFSNYEQARLAFWEDTVIPMLGLIASDWSAWLADGEYEFRPDLDDVPAIADKKATQWQMANASTDLTINERRALKGFEPVPGGDVILVTSSQIPLSMASGDLTAADIKALVYGAPPR